MGPTSTQEMKQARDTSKITKQLAKDVDKPSSTGLNFLVFVGGLLVFCILIGLLTLGKSLVIPLILATVLWYLINLLAKGYQRIPLLVGYMPKLVALPLSFVTVILLGWVIYAIVVSNATVALTLLSGLDMASNSEIRLQFIANVRELIDRLPIWVSASLPSDAELATSLEAVFSDLGRAFGTLWNTTKQALSQVSATASTIGLFAVFLVFLFFEQGTFDKKIKALTGTPDNFKAWSKAASEITNKLNTYVVIKSSMSLITALISLPVYWFFDIQFALFWALMVFLLNFIPFIGSIVAWLLPMIFVALSDYTLVEFVVVGLLLIAPHQFVGSFLEPRISGDMLNISPLVIILSMIFWNMVLGIIGLFVAVPLTVVTMTVLAQFKGTRWVAILLSKDGQSDS